MQMGRNGGIIAVVVKDSNGDWREDCQEMERAYMYKTEVHFSQSTTASTPFTQQPLLVKFGYLAVGEKVRRVSKVNYNPLEGTEQHV